MRGKINCFFSLIQEPNWSFKCSVKQQKSIIIYSAVCYDKSTNEDFYINANKNLAIINYEAKKIWIKFYSRRNYKCDSSYLFVYLYASAYLSYHKLFKMSLGSPNYANMVCEIPAYKKK